MRSDLNQTKYVDRAAQRRELFKDDPEVPEPTTLRPTVSAPAEELGDSNVGFKMLQSMGWKKGTGLGKEGDGIVNPIQVF